MEKIELKNIFTGEIIPAEDIMAALKAIFDYLFNFIKGEI